MSEKNEYGWALSRSRTEAAANAGKYLAVLATHHDVDGYANGIETMKVLDALCETAAGGRETTVYAYACTVRAAFWREATKRGIRVREAPK